MTTTRQTAPEPPYPEPNGQLSSHLTTRFRKYVAFITVGITLVTGAAVGVAVFIHYKHARSIQPTSTVRYLGVYEPDAPNSYAGVDQFAQAIGRQPNLVAYYSPWLEPFQVGFATAAANHGAITLVQIDPKNISLASIAAAQYDPYLRSYATAVKAFGGKVALSFGHEMNGNWYSWGHQHTSAATFVAAWRHIVNVFRTMGVRNVIWLWTVNIIDTLDNHVPNPVHWWPGSSYVNWVGVDGYYYGPSDTFDQVFGPTIVAVRELTRDPIFIAETGAEPGAGQPAKINDLFAGVRAYGLFGFLWFDRDDASKGLHWHLNTPRAFAAFRQDTKAFMRHPATPTPTPPSPSRSSSP
jgi:mannan endo-1,4-beta-mannosidase